VSWLLAAAGFAALIILHEAGHMVAAKAVGMRVERFFLFFPPKVWSFTRGETEYGIGAIPLGGFVKITGMNPEEEVELDDPQPKTGGEGVEPETVPAPEYPRSYVSQPVWKRIFVIAAGPAVNLVIAFVILFFLAFDLGQSTNRVDTVDEAQPAAAILQPGDKLVAVDGKRGDVEALRAQIATHECAGEQTDGCRAEKPVQLTIIRDGQRTEVEAKPVYDAAAGRPLLGFTYASRPLDLGPGGAADWAVDQMWTVTTKTVSIISRVFDAEERKQLSGVVGSYEVTRQSIEFDTRQALFVLALISLSLAVINLFPFLPLDGGHIFWSIVEKVRGRPASMRTMERASVIGFALVLVLFVIGLTNDIDRLSGEGFDVSR
jgi:regulator of sigma E protease